MIENLFESNRFIYGYLKKMIDWKQKKTVYILLNLKKTNVIDG